MDFNFNDLIDILDGEEFKKKPAEPVHIDAEVIINV